MEFLQVKESEFDFIFSEMEKNFILEERRDYAPAKELLENDDYKLFHIVKDGQNVGFISVWSFENFIFIEHFVVYEKFRNCGLGAKALILAKEKWRKLVLEAELPQTEMSKRRIGFYQRNEFFKNSGEYYQPSYRKGGDGVYLALMSYPTALVDFEKTVKIIHEKVYNR